jgi:hypothetical protein
MRKMVLITVALFTTAALIYRKNRFKPELSAWLLFIFIILTLVSLFYYFVLHFEVRILILIYAIGLLVIFFSIGKNNPIKTWKDIFVEYRHYLYGPEIESIKGLELIRFRYKKSLLRLKKYLPIYLFAGLITVIVHIMWLILERTF